MSSQLLPRHPGYDSLDVQTLSLSSIVINHNKLLAHLGKISRSYLLPAIFSGARTTTRYVNILPRGNFGSMFSNSDSNCRQSGREYFHAYRHHQVPSFRCLEGLPPDTMPSAIESCFGCAYSRSYLRPPSGMVRCIAVFPFMRLTSSIHGQALDLGVFIQGLKFLAQRTNSHGAAFLVQFLFCRYWSSIWQPPSPQKK